MDQGDTVKDRIINNVSDYKIYNFLKAHMDKV